MLYEEGNRLELIDIVSGARYAKLMEEYAHAVLSVPSSMAPSSRPRALLVASKIYGKGRAMGCSLES